MDEKKNMNNEKKDENKMKETKNAAVIWRNGLKFNGNTHTEWNVVYFCLFWTQTE